MDVVNGKIVSVRTDRKGLAEVYSALLMPSQGLTVENMQSNPDHFQGDGINRAPSRFSDENQSNPWRGPGALPCYGPPNSLALDLDAGVAGSNQRPLTEKHPSGALDEYVGFQSVPVTERRQGCGSDEQYNHSRAFSWSESKLDLTMMAMYESQNPQAVRDHFAAAKSLGQESPTLYLPSENAECSISLRRSWSDCTSMLQEVEAQSIHNLSSSGGTSSDLKRKRLEAITCEEAYQADCEWRHPLKLLIRKGLTLSDVKGLGRIIIPKKHAESAAFQQIDTKEGALLEMEDYTCSKRWFFRFKWWINNRSRMYVLENTGEFIKYHSLKENDIFVVYQDNFQKLVPTPKAVQNIHPPPNTTDRLLRPFYYEESCKIAMTLSQGVASILS